jgi:cytochrome c oxidase cbb3-type subunit III
MKSLIRILTSMMILVAIPIVLFAFFPRYAVWVDQQKWSQNFYLFLTTAGSLALFLGLDLLNRVEVYKQYVQSSPEDQNTFWDTHFQKHRLGFLKYGIGAILIMAVVLVFLVFNLMILPKAPTGNWYLWSIKIFGIAIGAGVLVLLNGVLFLDNGKKVILGIDTAPTERAAKKQLTWQDKLFQIKPTFMDAEVDLKEDFDGITELDNPPPPWFMWLFYSTIIFGIVYFVRYPMMHYGENQLEEYNSSFASYESSKKKFNANQANNVDENTVTLEKDKSKLADAASLFKTKCATCHGPDGGGLPSSGPNLTDDYWIHGNSVKEVFKTIKYGVQSAGMVSWDGQISPSKMQAVASYILSLRGTNPPNAQPSKGVKMEPKEKF